MFIRVMFVVLCAAITMLLVEGTLFDFRMYKLLAIAAILIVLIVIAKNKSEKEDLQSFSSQYQIVTLKESNLS